MINNYHLNIHVITGSLDNNNFLSFDLNAGSHQSFRFGTGKDKSLFYTDENEKVARRSLGISNTSTKLSSVKCVLRNYLDDNYLHVACYVVKSPHGFEHYLDTALELERSLSGFGR